MLYWFYRHLDINIFQYLTVRAGIGFFISFLLTIYLIPKFIEWAKSKNASQPIYELAPESHQAKSNTPTMGGIVFLASSLFAMFLTVKLNNIFVIGGILTIITFGFIGIKDDLSKIFSNKNSDGLSAKQKLILQFTFAFIISTILFLSNMNTELYIPFYKHSLFNMGVFSIFFWALVIVASSNAVNLTDGLDGLATVPSVFALGTLSILVYITGNVVLSGYLLLPTTSNVGEIMVIGVSLAGSLIGFLWYNCHPAEIFMGDSGSLTVGAFIGYMSIVAHSEILLILIGFVFVMETMSVILQVGSYKTRKKRIFLMAPIHHHFEMKGWHENKVIVRFWIIALMTNLLALATLKIR